MSALDSLSLPRHIAVEVAAMHLLMRAIFIRSSAGLLHVEGRSLLTAFASRTECGATIAERR